MSRIVKAYACEFKCGIRYKSNRKAMEVHESRCFRNPERKACITCRHFQKDTETVYNPDHNGDPGSTDYEREFTYCDKDIDLTEKLRADCAFWGQNHRNNRAAA